MFEVLRELESKEMRNERDNKEKEMQNEKKI